MILRMIVKELVRSSLGILDYTSVLMIKDFIKSEFLIVFVPLNACSVLESMLIIYSTRSSNSLAICDFFA